ncbi:ATP-binding protein [Crocosphaera sp. UHCC 0190]|uniref:ATP-binding protein n=1 Tax=Crocosphaera sp. UHCC 0190 TaxID=3110246 RepID=UPI002B1FB3ED|nr:ATP-binding protein [Crocosphaera sp. UHCC 0190]MEA5508510.1 ATP-binding protein [Crocosphaera sp. UHCC 0190]
MSQIKVKNFGSIKSGFAENNGLMDIRKITVFIGNQGTGKSSIAKLISTLSWLEKALYVENLEEKYITNYNRFVSKYCGYHLLNNYFSSDTEIQYQGNAYSFNFKQGRLNIYNNKDTLFYEKYVVPKIMYVPAERNFFSVVKQPEKIKGLPESLYTFWEELERSKRELSEHLTLPVGNVKFEFDDDQQQSYILGNDYKLELSETSSGFQSFVPLFLVSRNIALSIDKKQEYSQTELSGEEKQVLQTKVQKILSDDNLADEVKEAALKLLSSKYRPECFLNIVEEIEQNLFPTSQKDVFYKLLEFANLTKGNGLILTTHSPYIINYLTLAIKGYQVWQKILSSPNAELLKQQLEKIVPEASCISEEDAIVYELTEQGEIMKLPTYEGLPSDENYLNSSLAETNQLFNDLLEIEEQL